MAVDAGASLKARGQVGWSKAVLKLVPWETRSPRGACKLALCPGHILRENPGGNRW